MAAASDAVEEDGAIIYACWLPNERLGVVRSRGILSQFLLFDTDLRILDQVHKDTNNTKSPSTTAACSLCRLRWMTIQYRTLFEQNRQRFTPPSLPFPHLVSCISIGLDKQDGYALRYRTCCDGAWQHGHQSVPVFGMGGFDIHSRWYQKVDDGIALLDGFLLSGHQPDLPCRVTENLVWLRRRFSFSQVS